MNNGFFKIKKKIENGERITLKEGLFLFNSNDLLSIGELASLVNNRKNGKNVYFIVNRHINPTNICVNRCKFCAFSKDKGEAGAYEMTLEEIFKRAEDGAEDGASEFHIVGGLHPDLPFAFYLDMLKGLKKRFPDIHIQGFTMVEIDYFSKISGLSIEETLLSLKEAGIGSIPGGGAEIFAEGVRSKICPDKIKGERWLEIAVKAHKLGIKSNATMLYGHIEKYEDRVDHLEKLRKVQDETYGFQSFIPLSFHSKNTDILKSHFTTGVDDLKTLAIARIYLDNFPHIKAFWIMLGEKISQVSLSFGVDDIDGTVVEEKITHSAGAETKEAMTKDELVRLIKDAGKIPVERDTLYNIMRIY